MKKSLTKLLQLSYKYRPQIRACQKDMKERRHVTNDEEM